MFNKKRKGFTLIELLVVIAIIGLLATLAVVALNNARSKSRDAKRVSDIKQIQTALELFYLDNNGYPTGAGITLGTSPQLCLGTTYWAASCTDPYMGSVPKNPTPNGANYVYYGTSATSYASAYSITFNLENVTGGLTAGNHVATQSGIN